MKKISYLVIALLLGSVSQAETQVVIRPLNPVDCRLGNFSEVNRLTVKEIHETDEEVEITFSSSYFSCQNGVYQYTKLVRPYYLPYIPIGFWQSPLPQYLPDIQVVDWSSKSDTYIMSIEKQFIFDSGKASHSFVFTTRLGSTKYPWRMDLELIGRKDLRINFSEL